MMFRESNECSRVDENGRAGLTSTRLERSEQRKGESDWDRNKMTHRRGFNGEHKDAGGAGRRADGCRNWTRSCSTRGTQ